MKRKSFIIAASVMAFSMLGVVSCANIGKGKSTPEKKEIGVQMYSLRDMLKTDYEGAVKALGEIGYTSVEAADYRDGKFYGKNPEDFKKDIENAGMKVVSSHTSRKLTSKELETGDFSESLKWWDEAIAAHKKAGMKYIVMPSMPHKNITEKDVKRYCDYFNAVGKKCAEAGIAFGYHNHNFEFRKFNDKYMLDYLIENTDPKYVFFQMDVYWIVRGQNSPVDYLKKYPNRFKLLHLKDHRELGQSGMVGFDAIFRSLKGTAVEGVFIEVEKYSFDPVKSCKISYDYINKAPFTPATYKKAASK